MGIEPFLLSSSLLAVLSQRLVRLLCRACRQPVEPGPLERDQLGLSDEEAVLLYQPKGCSECNFTGYRGRTGIYEMIEIDDQLRGMIYEGASEQAMLEVARQRYPGIEVDGRRRVLAGETSLAELLRVTSAA